MATRRYAWKSVRARAHERARGAALTTSFPSGVFTNLTVTFEGGGGGGPNRISSGVAADARIGVLRSARGVAGAPHPTTTHGAAATSRVVRALNVGAMAAATASVRGF